MKQDHRQFEETSTALLPAPLPAGERVIWQGKPSFTGLALRTFHIRTVGIYFGALMIWRLASGWLSGVAGMEAVTPALWLLAPAISAIAVLAGLAWLFRRAACYTITTKRILFQFGVALPITMNIPLGKIANAALKTYRDGSGDIPVQVNDGKRVSYVLLWPHIRPWRLRAPEPMLNSIPDAANVAARLAAALNGQPGPSAIGVVRLNDAGCAANAIAGAPTTAAA